MGKSTKTPRKRVKFNPKMSVQLIQGRKEMTKDGSISDLFLFLEDYQLIRGGVRNSVKMIENEGIQNENQYLCTRGLESRIRVAKKERRNKKACIRKVLEQQANLNPESLATLIATNSLKCVTAAHSLALKDAQEASDYLLQSEEDEFEEILL